MNFRRIINAVSSQNQGLWLTWVKFANLSNHAIVRYRIESMSHLRILSLCFCAFVSQVATAQEPPSPGRDNAIVESLLRIPDAKMEAYPQHTDAIKRYLKKTAGTAQYLRVVGQLGVTGEDSNLSAMLNAVPVSTESTQAAKWLLENGRKSLVQAAIAHTDDEKASAALSAIGYLNTQAANDLLLSTMQDSQRSRIVRTAAATALGKKPRGQRLLLKLTSEKKITEDLEFAVADSLLGSEVPEIREEASKLVRPAVAGTSEAIPPVKKLAEMRGTAEKGKIVFNTVGTCSKCHKIHGEGKEVGPDLSEIGSKLSREEMFVSILNPSAAVSHNYETYSALTNDGSVLTGTLINQTDKSITIRSADAIETTIKSEDLDQLKKQSLSLMPEGLHKAMPLQSLVDLVDYMVLLRKPEEEGFNLVTRKKPKPQSEESASREPKDALAGLAVADGVDLQLFSSEPMMLSPTSIDVDHLGRVWIAEAVNYRHFRNQTNEERKEGDRIIVMEDTDHDGKADKLTVFYQGPEIDSPHGVCVLGNQIVVSAGANVWVFTDDDGDLKADRKRALFTGIDGVQHDHGIHAVTVGPDGKLYFNFGNEGKRICDADGKLLRDLAGNAVENTRKPYQEGMVFRCNLDGSEFETLGWNFRNNWELCLDSFGTMWQSDNDDDGNRGTRINYVMEFGNYGYKDQLTGATWKTERTGMEQEIPLRHWHLNDPGVVPNLLQTGAGSPTGITFYEGELLPSAFRNQMIHCDPGPNVVRAYPTSKSKAGYTATIANLVQGVEDQWFRPVDVSTAPDGSLFIADWYDPGVGGHRMGDTKRGRVFRAVPNKHAGYRFSAPDFSTLEGSILALQSPNTATQYLAQQALLKMGASALPALETLFKNHASPRMRARAAWQMARIPGHATNVVEQLMKDSDADLRIVGIRIARQQKLDLIAVTKRLVNDESPQVRRELAIALRHSKSPEMPALWAQLAKQHDGQDRWYLEALGIGADLRSDECFDAWLRLVGDEWNTASGRDIVWRSRSSKACDYLSKILFATENPAEQDRYFRAMDFHDPKQVAQVLAQAAGL
jgi:putative membrane-bound dehydrogenase-like protein